MCTEVELIQFLFKEKEGFGGVNISIFVLDNKSLADFLDWAYTMSTENYYWKIAGCFQFLWVMARKEGDAITLWFELEASTFFLY